MASVTFAVDEEFNRKLSNFLWINLSELVRERLIERQKQAELLFKKLSSPEEKALTRWSVELGRKAKKGRFKQVLSEVSPKIRKKLLDSMSPEERQEYG
jgi:hypothetical protein